MATSTPWGASQTSRKIVKGITFYSTASHGGIKLSATMNEKVHPAFRDASRSFGSNRAKGWYEEDCDVAIVVRTFPEHFTDANIAAAKLTLCSYHKEAYAVAFPEDR